MYTKLLSTDMTKNSDILNKKPRVQNGDIAT